MQSTEIIPDEQKLYNNHSCDEMIEIC